MKIDRSGNLLWWRTSMNSEDEFLPIAALVDSNENLVVIGITESETTNLDIILHSWSNSGDIRWSTVYNSPWNNRDTPWGAAMDESGNTYVAGDYWRLREGKELKNVKGLLGLRQANNSVFLESMSPESCLAIYPIILKVDNRGNLIWVDNYEYWVNSGQFLFCEYARGKVYVSGQEVNGALYSECMDTYGQQLWHYRNDDYFFSTGYGDECIDQNGNFYFTARKSSPNPGLFVLSLDPMGRVRFFNVFFPGKGGSSIAVDSFGYLFVGGTLGDSVSSDFLVMKMDTLGNIRWFYQKDGGLQGYDQTEICLGLLPDNHGGVFATGLLYDSAMTPIHYVVHLADTTSGIKEDATAKSSLIITPAPSGFYITGPSGEARIYDSAGRLVIRREIKGKTLISPLVPGVYFVVAGDERAKVTVR